MHLLPRVSALLLAACIPPPPAYAQAQPPAPAALDTAALARRVPALMDSGGVPGLAVAVLRGGGLAWARGFGVRREGGSEPVGGNTVFEAASLSKPVFAYLVLKLADQGTIDLDRPLAAHVTLAGLTDTRAARITPRMVLSHTTGLPNELHPGDTLALAFDPGTRFRYSGEGFAYLQRVVEQVTGQRLEELARTLVFEPLGMARSGFAWEDRFAPDAATGHGGGRIPRRPGRPAAARAPSSLHTTVLDYARFVAAVLAGEGLRDSTVREMAKAQVAVAPGAAWGLGWALQETGAAARLFHWGDNSNTGFTAFVVASPDDGSGMVWLANSAGGLSIAAPLLEMTMPAPRLPVEGLGYERYDDPKRLVREEIDRVAAARGAAAALRTLRRMRARLPADRFDERLLNTIGYRMLERGRPADAVALFRENVALYPQSGNVHDSLGEALAAAGDREAALASYRRSLALDPSNRNAAEMIRRLGGRP